MTTSPSRLAAPALPATQEKPAFPLVASLAPVVVSVAIWLVTQSPFSLLFAALGPAVAVASVVDARRTGRRRQRRELERFDRELLAARAEVADAHGRERSALEASAPSGSRLADSGLVLWAESSSFALCVGTGRRASTLSVDGFGAARGDEPAHRALRTLQEEAATLLAAPIAVHGAAIGIAGPLPCRRALERSLLLQLAARLSPAEYSIAADDAEGWMDALPHHRERSDSGGVEFRSRSGGAAFVVVTAEHASALPRSSTVVTVGGLHAEVGGESIAPDYLSQALAAGWAEQAAAIALRERLVASEARLPESLAFADLGPPRLAAVEEHGSLEVVVGIGEEGPVSLDLVNDGPHAVVGGMTGSGKSELLVTWLLAMASRFDPRQVSFLLFDFKGGAGFGDLATLPHAVGLVTDLDQPGAARALESLAAELRYRERLLATAGRRSIGDLLGEGYPGRLVVVVDEFAAMATDFPELHAAFGDLAARGRSLGVHLVLCTQRPAGVVRDAVLANAGLRISLRVNNRADSVAVIGTDAAAALTGTAPGRAMVVRSSGTPQPVQLAIATPDDLSAVRRADGFVPRRPWLDPLPAGLLLSDIAHAAAGVAFGRVDLPAEQAQPAAIWNPATDGALLVVGAAGSGKTTALRALGAARWIPSDLEGAWDRLVDAVAAGATGGLTVIDDLDELVARFDDDYQRPLLELVSHLARAKAPLAVSAQRLGAPLQQLASLCDSRLLLRMPSRQDHLLAGGSAAGFDPDLPAGGGYWRGARVQVGLAIPLSAPASPSQTPLQSPPPRPTVPTSIPFVPLGPVLAVSARPSALVARLRARGLDAVEVGPPGTGDPLELAVGIRVLVADADTWQAHWGALGTLRSRCPLLFAGSSLAEFRAISRARILPPPIATASTTCWLLSAEGALSRVTL